MGGYIDPYQIMDWLIISVVFVVFIILCLLAAATAIIVYGMLAPC